MSYWLHYSRWRSVKDGSGWIVISEAGRIAPIPYMYAGNEASKAQDRADELNRQEVISSMSRKEIEDALDKSS
jgi:hypothetical protein